MRSLTEGGDEALGGSSVPAHMLSSLFYHPGDLRPSRTDRQTDRQSVASPPALRMEWGRDTLRLTWLGKGGVLVTQIPQPPSGASPVSTPRLWSTGNVPSWDKSYPWHPGSSLCAHPALLALRMRRGQGRESIQLKTTLLGK